VQCTQKYANNAKTAARNIYFIAAHLHICNKIKLMMQETFIAACILFVFTCADGLNIIYGIY